LRGVRYLFTKGEFAQQIGAFISLDGAGISQIVNRALGSRRYKVTLTGSGGHSWLDAGAPNPVHAVGRVVAKLTAFRMLSTKEKTTFNVGKISGGTSVNAIPTMAEIEVDLRSESSSELQRLDAYFRLAVDESLTEENAQGKANYSPLELNLELTGDRPSGKTDSNERLVQLAIEATKAIGAEPNLTVSSTDANLPMSLNIPAITLGAGGTGDRMHTLDEWYNPAGREIGLNRALLLILSFVELT
jgi:acetylornithine deacetylase/succinyl-diaminopimelate desuccinylase-like protein